MSDIRKQQVETAVQIDVEQTDVEELLFLNSWYLIQNFDNSDSASDSYESCYSGNGTDTVTRVAGNLTNEIDEFIVGVRRRCDKNILGRELSADAEKLYHEALSFWNTFLQSEQDEWSTSAIISSDIQKDINKYIRLKGAQWDAGNKKWIRRWLPRWNMFLQARAGKTVVTRLNLFFTIVGFIIYIVDLGSDIGTSMYYAKNGQWWQAMVTLAIIYCAVVIHTIIKWTNGQIYFTGSTDWLRYVASSLVNWPDVKQYGRLCLLEWKRHKSPAINARLIPEWYERRRNVALLKCTEGACEACPQAILQLCLLVPDLYGDWTWTDYLRFAGASVSLCTAGAALVNMEKYWKIMNYIHLPLSELAVLHVWAVPVTVSRLLSVTLLLSVHPYWALAGVALHLVLYGVYYCRTWGVPHSLADVIDMCLTSLKFFMSPFVVVRSTTYRRVLHAIHFLVNTAMTVVWALGTPLMYAQPVLCTAIIPFNAVMFAVGLLGWQLHEKYWPGSYFIENND